MSETQKLQNEITLDICGGCDYLDENLECTRQNPVSFPNCYVSVRESKGSAEE